MHTCKNILIGAFFILAFNGCTLKHKTSQVHLSTLPGNWIIINVSGNRESIDEGSLTEARLDSLDNRLKLMPVQFGEKNKLYIENGINSPFIDSFYYQLNPDKPLVVIRGDINQSVLAIDSLSNVKMEGNWILPFENNHRMIIGLVMLKVKNEETVFKPELLRWKIKPLKPESDEEINIRLKSLLNYDCVYSRNIYYSNAPVIDTRKLYLPLRYYDGGVGLQSIYKSMSFISIFYNKDDAVKAYDLLSNSLSKVEYPNKNHYILEYAELFKRVAAVM